MTLSFVMHFLGHMFGLRNMILGGIPLEALVVADLSQEAEAEAEVEAEAEAVVGAIAEARAAASLQRQSLRASHLKSLDQGLLVPALHQGLALCQDLLQGPGLLCLLVKKEGARVPKDAVLAGVQVGAGARPGAGASVYPGLDLKLLCCLFTGEMLLRGVSGAEDAYEAFMFG